MSNHEHEFRLCWLIAQNAIVLVAGWRLARSLSAAGSQRVCDTLLAWWLIQYLAVGAAGIGGWLTPIGLTVTSIVLSLPAIILPFRRTGGDPRGVHAARPFMLGAMFVLAFAAATVFDARILPAMADDPLTYHLPAAAQWLQDRRITVFETWYFNPANAYSPLAGSLFATWLIAPMQNDVIARFVQAPAVLAIYAAAFGIAVRLGGSVWTAMCIGISAALCRPIVSQAILAKDDLFLCAFVLLAINAAGQTGRFAVVRLGVAMGLAAATKYTSVYALLMMLLCVRLREWRHWLAAGGIALLMVAPWLARNFWLTGNPLFPVTIRLGDWTLASGLFTTTRSDRLASAAGVWECVVPGYFGIGVPMLIALAATYVAALASAVRSISRDARTRVILLGPPLCVAAFVLSSPYAELRFIYAAVALLPCAAALIRPSRLQPMAAVIVAVIAVVTSFVPDWSLRLSLLAAGATLIAWAIAALAQRDRRMRVATAVACALAWLGAVWVYWSAYVESLPAAADIAWVEQRGDLARAWAFVRNELPAGQTIAYANTYMVYPLQGWRLDRRVVPLAGATGGRRLHRLPPISGAVNESSLLKSVMARIEQEDFGVPTSAWARSLRAHGIRYLFIGKRLSPWPGRAPLESDAAYASAAQRAVASGMRVLFQNDAAVVLQVQDSDQ